MHHLTVDRLAGDDVDAGVLQGFDLAWVVGQQQDLLHAELVEHFVGDAEIALTREALGWKYAPFEIPSEIYAQ